MGLDTLITGIEHVGIRVRYLERARTFYKALGFRFVAGPVGPEPVAILDHPSVTVVNFILNATSSQSENVLMDLPAQHPDYTHMALAVTDLGATQSELEAQGVHITEGPIDLGPGVRAFFVRDPDGNVIELNESQAR